MGKTIRSLYCFLMAGLFSFASPGLLMAGTANVTVAWDAIVGSALAGYTVVWGQASKSYINSQNLGIVTQVTLQLETGKTYYLAVRGFDKQGVAGELSNEISTLVPGTDKGSPVISNLSITSVTASSATIYFDTDK